MHLVKYKDFLSFLSFSLYCGKVLTALEEVYESVRLIDAVVLGRLGHRPEAQRLLKTLNEASIGGDGLVVG